MPPRLNLLTKSWSSFDLPILPFLAPRVCQPWPHQRHRIHTGTAQAAEEKLHAAKTSYDESPPEDYRDRATSVDFSTVIQGTQHTAQDFDALSKDARDEVSWLDGLGKSPGRRNEGQNLGEGTSGISEDGKRRKFEAGRGPSSHKQPVAALEKGDGALSGPESFENPEEETFHKIYQEIWGSRVKKQPATVPVRRVSYSPSDEAPLAGARPARPPEFSINYFFLHRNTIKRQIQRSGLKRNQMKQQWAEKLNTLAASRRRKVILKGEAYAKMQNLPLSRPKWVRHKSYADPELYHSFHSWHRRFAVLNHRNELVIRGRKLPTRSFRQTSRFPLTFLRNFMKVENSMELRLQWEKLAPRRKMEIWPELMIKTLQYWPGKTLTMMAGTYAQEPFPPPYALSDCLNFVISRYLGVNRSPTSNVVRKIHNATFGLLRIGPPGYLEISQNSIFLLLSHTEPFLLKKLYRIMADLKHPLHRNTLMHFTSRLAKAGETDTVLEILQKLKDYGSDFNTPEMLSLCSTVLDRSLRRPDTNFSDSHIFERMFEWGLQPNIITYNVLVKNSVNIGDHSTAWQIHDMMIESGIEPDAYTYSILLNDSKNRMDSQAIEAVMGFVREKGLKSAYIITDVLDAIFLLYQQKAKETDQPHEPQAAFTHMLKVYMENFQVEPLTRIIPWVSQILPSVQSPRSPLSGAELEYPPVSTLTLMITAFIHGLRDAWAVKQFYDHFRLLLATGDAGVTDLLGTTHVWNSVIMALGKFPDTLVDCTAIVGDMLGPTKAAVNENSVTQPIEPATSPHDGDVETLSKMEDSGDDVEMPNGQLCAESTPTEDFAQLPGETEEQSRRPHIPPAPSVHTWSILLKIFMSQHQSRAAEKVLTMMQEKGVKPNFVTWTTLANGYSRLQDMEKTVDVVSRMNKSGLEADAQWLLSMFKVRNRKALLEAMRSGNTQLNTGTEFLDQLQADLKRVIEVDQLQDDIRRSWDVEQFPELTDEDESFVIGDLQDGVEDGVVRGFDDDSEAWEDDDVEVKRDQEPEHTDLP